MHAGEGPTGLERRLRMVMGEARAIATTQPAPAEARSAAVLVLADVAKPGLPLLFMLRSDRVPSHQGQIGFPGGGAHPGDTDPVATALRETEEEMGIGPADVEVVGLLTPQLTAVSHRWLTPVVAVQRRAVVVRPDPFEVAEWFRVDLATLLEAPHTTRILETDGVQRTVHLYQAGKRVIWGVTGAIVHELLTLLGRSD